MDALSESIDRAEEIKKIEAISETKNQERMKRDSALRIIQVGE